MALPDPASMALELVLNSIDSSPTNITLLVDLRSDIIRCSDNGQGIPENLFSHSSIPTSHSKSNSFFKRNKNSLRTIADFAQISISTMTPEELVIRHYGAIEHDAIELSGTVVTLTHLYSDYKVRKLAFSEPRAAILSKRRILTFINTLAINFPNIEFLASFEVGGSYELSLAPAKSKGDRLRRLLHSSPNEVPMKDHICILLPASPIPILENFTANKFPCSSLTIDGTPIKPVLNSFSEYSGIISAIQWGTNGLSISLTTSSAPLMGSEVVSGLEYVGVFASSYIIARRRELLYAVDQHAAHERVNLEYLLGKLDTSKESSNLKYPITLPAEVSSLFTKKVLKELGGWGWRVAKNGKEWRIEAVPKVCDVIVKDVKGMVEYATDVELDCQPRIPECIMLALKTRACKVSIKFGDEIGEEEAKDLLEKLGRCHRSNHCAHGRPVVIPIFNIEDPTEKFVPI